MPYTDYIDDDEEEIDVDLELDIAQGLVERPVKPVKPVVADPEAAKELEEPPLDGESETEEEDDDEDDGEALFKKEHRRMIWMGFKILLAIAVVVYLVAAFIIDFQRALALFIITVLFISYNIFYFFVRQNKEAFDSFEDRIVTFFERTDTDWRFAGGITAVLVAVMGVIIAFNVNDSRNLVSLLGLFGFFFLSWVFSWKPRRVKVRPVIGGVFIQFIFGYVVIRTSWGLTTMEFLGDIFTTLLGYTIAGSSFVFAWLTDGSLFGRPFQLANDGGEYFLGPPFFFSVLPTVIFFSALMSVGYYIRALPWLVKKLGYFLGLLLGTSASESLSAAGNIFVGQTEAPLLVRPYMASMTESELHAIMTGGFATIAGSVFGLYVSFGIDPVAILAASVMSAPAALAISKVVYPETEDSPTAAGKKGVYEIPASDDRNIVHAATNGAVIGTQLMLNIAGNLVAFLAIIEMLDQLIIYLGNRVDADVSFNRICEIVFWPVAWLMGVDADDCDEIAIVLGLKIFANEFVAYERLAFTFQSQISERSYYIASYALCGFSNFGSIGIQLGGLTPMAPNQGGKLAKLVFSAMIAGNTACLVTACIAGIFFESTA